MGLSSREVEDRTFSSSMRGYDKDEVKAFLGDVARQLSTQEEQIAIATAKAEKAKEELDSLNDVLAARLEEAKQARNAIIEEAKQEAAQIAATADGGHESAEAARTAAAIVAEAETKAALRMKDVEATTEAAQAEADRILKEADSDAGLKLAEAERVLENARREAREMHNATEKDRTELETTVHELRRLLAAAQASDGDLENVDIVVKNGEQIIVDLRASAPQKEDVPN